ncbi:MAG: CHAD domain-containing protein [Alkalilacustris sp.]
MPPPCPFPCTRPPQGRQCWTLLPRPATPRAMLRALRPAAGRLVTTQSAPDRPVTLLDTFDAELAATGQFLIGDDQGMTLLGCGADPAQPVCALPSLVADLPPGPVRAALVGRVSPLRRIGPVGQARMTRLALALLDDIDKTVLGCDVALFETGDDRCAGLLRARALRGYDAALVPLAEGLRARGAMAGLDASAIIAALFPDHAGDHARPTRAMSPDTTVFGAATDIIATQIAAARHLEAEVVDGRDSAFLHQYRIALRKVRSVLSLFKGAYDTDRTVALKGRLGRLMARTGRLRDLDVYLLERPGYLDAVPAAVRPGLDRLFAVIAAERVREHAALAGHLTSAAHAQDMGDLASLFDRPQGRLCPGPLAGRSAIHEARGLIWRRYRKVCRIASTIDEATPDAQVHALRIQCKKLRYLMEVFGPIFPPDQMRPLIKALKRLQDVLGAFNDCTVQQVALTVWLDSPGPPRGAHRLEMAKGIGALLTILDQRQRAARDQVMGRFARFDARATRTGFRTLFKTPGTPA